MLLFSANTSIFDNTYSFVMQLKILGILVAELVFVGAVLAGVLGGAHSHNKRTEIVGILCVIFGTARYASPLSIMVRIFCSYKKLKCAEVYWSFNYDIMY